MSNLTRRGFLGAVATLPVAAQAPIRLPTSSGVEVFAMSELFGAPRAVRGSWTEIHRRDGLVWYEWNA